MTENDDVSYNSSYNLPWVSKPAGTQYFDIYDYVYFYKDGNENRLADVYKFEIVTIDKINVYCYKDGQTYTLYR
jgi:hypothetical protein